MAVVYGFKRSKDPVNGDNTLWLYNEDEGTVTLTIKREPVGSNPDPYPITWFKLNWDHWNGLTSSDYTILTKPQADSRVDDHYYFENGQKEFDIKIKLTNDSIDESMLLEGLTAEITNVQELTLDPHVVASSQHDTLSPIASIGIVDDDKTTIGLKVKDATGSEGSNVGFVVEANKPAPHDTTVYLQVQASTTAGIASGNWWVSDVIKVGKTSTTVDIKTVTDTLQDNSRIDVKLFSYDDSFVITDSTAVGVVNNTTEAPTPVVPITTVTAVDLADHIDLITDLNNQVGANSTASILSGDKELSSLGMTMDALGLLVDGIKSVVSWFPGSTPYASAAELPGLGLTENQIMQGYRLMSWANPEDNPARDVSVSWKASEVESSDWLGLQAGDYVDGRLVIHQPWMSLDGSSSSSIQGRDGGDNFSHKEVIPNSFDWGRTSEYAIAPTDAYVMYVDDSNGAGSSNAGLGNVVTLKAVEKTATDKDIYLTFAHLKKDSVNPLVDIAYNEGGFIKAGTMLGVTGDTGGNYPVHLHMQAGTTLEGNYSNAQIDSTPPVYMLGFTDVNVSTLATLGETDLSGKYKVQDYGFPIGDTALDDAGNAIEPFVVTSVESTFSVSEFNVLNPSLGTGSEPTPTVDVIEGSDGVDNSFTGTPGDDYYDGKGGYNQVNYLGNASDRKNFDVTENPDETIKVVSVEYGIDTLKNIQGIWFQEEFKWYTIEDLLAPVNTFYTTPDDPVLEGTSTVDILNGDANQNWFIGSLGNDTYNGFGEYDQVEYYGPNALIENFNFLENTNGSVLAQSPFGAETYNGIEGVWLDPQQAGVTGQWYSVDALTLL